MSTPRNHFQIFVAGYTGLLTAEHIATSFPTDLKWAVAGRSEEKLQKLVSTCQALEPSRIQPGANFLETENRAN
jgi:short subunit dehydrogenase-like uncharacterized protein